jgi:hypothetical protein
MHQFDEETQDYSLLCVVTSWVTVKPVTHCSCQSCISTPHNGHTLLLAGSAAAAPQHTRLLTVLLLAAGFERAAGYEEPGALCCC